MIPAWWGYGKPGESYQPSNGTEGTCFHEEFCFQCERDRDGNCQILADSFRRQDDPKFPREWVYDEKGWPTCKAFVQLGDPIPPPRDDRTIDMFGDAP